MRSASSRRRREIVIFCTEAFPFEELLELFEYGPSKHEISSKMAETRLFLSVRYAHDASRNNCLCTTRIIVSAVSRYSSALRTIAHKITWLHVHSMRPSRARFYKSIWQFYPRCSLVEMVLCHTYAAMLFCVR